jgi:hypothetical protein
MSRLAVGLLVAGLTAAGCSGARSAPPSPAGGQPAPTPAVPVPTPPPQAPTPVPEARPAEATVEVAPPPAAAVPEQPAVAATSEDRPYRDILSLKEAGFSDDFLLNKIRTDDVRYQLTTSEILRLRSAGLSEAVIAAMLRSGQPSGATAGVPIARQAEFAGLARVSKSFLGVFGTSTRNVGRLTVEGDRVSWFETEDPSKNFSVYAKNVKEIFNTCVLRPGQNLCLELGVVTFTGEEYRFRDPGWKKGENRLVTEATTYFRQAFPQLFFSQRTVSEM